MRSFAPIFILTSWTTLAFGACSTPTALSNEGQTSAFSSDELLPSLSPAQRDFGPAQAEQLALMGAKLVRIDFAFFGDSARRERLIAQVRAAKAKGLGVIAQVNYDLVPAPARAIDRQTFWHRAFDSDHPEVIPPFVTSFTDSLHELVETFSGPDRLDVIELWNEPNALPRPLGFDPNRPIDVTPENADWDGACNPESGGYAYGGDDGAWALCPDLLGALTVASYRVIHETSSATGTPPPKVTAANVLTHGELYAVYVPGVDWKWFTSWGWVARAYVEKLVDSPAVRAFRSREGRWPWDYVGVHPYSKRGGSGEIRDEVQAIEQAMRSRGGPVTQVAISEYGWRVCATGDHDCTTDEETRARLLWLGFAEASDAHVAYLTWFEYLTRQDAANAGHDFGLFLEGRDGASPQPRRSAWAFCEVGQGVGCDELERKTSRR